MAELWLMRHAKSDWREPVPDFDRPLNGRGERDALAMGEWLARHTAAPESILASPARRARRTARLVAAAWDLPEDCVEYRDALYLADRDTLVRLVGERLRDSVESLLLVGHNPGLDELVTWLSDTPPGRTRNGKLMTTAAVAVFTVPAGRLLVPRTGRLRFLARPKALREAGWPDLPGI